MVALSIHMCMLKIILSKSNFVTSNNNYTPTPQRGRGVYCFTSVRLSVLPSVQDIFRRIFLSNCWWQKSDIWSQASYRYTISWEAFLDPSDSYFLFADLAGFYTHWRYMHIFRHIFLSNLPPLFGKQEVGIWRVKKRFPRYGVPIWSLWSNIRSLPSIVAEKNVTKNVHISSMCIKTS
jgi:hypothetical protein